MDAIISITKVHHFLQEVILINLPSILKAENIYIIDLIEKKKTENKDHN